MVLWWMFSCSWVAEQAGVDVDIDEAQIEKMCKVANRLDAEGKLPSGRKLEKLLSEAASEHLGDGGQALLKLAMKTPPGARRKIVDEVLKHNGIDSLDCPVLEKVLFQ